LTAALAVGTVTPAFAGKPQQRQHGQHTRASERDMDASRKHRGGRRKTVEKTFANGDVVAIPALDAVDQFGPADVYPSTLAVSGFKRARITDLNLTLRGFSHVFPGDVQLVLVAPGGRNAVVMGDVDSNDLGDETVTDLTLTLDDEAAALLPEDVPLTSGSFRPLDGIGPGIDGDLTAFPAPAPEPSGDNALSTFDGINPNGEWRLFILDDDQIDEGSLANGWVLQITARSKGKKKR
jgi:subtilisin-like proprotein convertase family protein